MTGCAHSTVRLLNPWELLRKYVCGDCDAIMTCACCSDIAIFVLPHQAGRGVDPDSKLDAPVTAPLVAGVCMDCRGITPPAYPKAPLRGAASVIHRYYWHELATRTFRAQLAWCQERGLPLLDAAGQPLVLWTYPRQYPQEFDALAAQVFAEIRAEHENSPRYDVARSSDADILAAHAVPVLAVRACYVEPPPERKVLVMNVGGTDPTQAVSVEQFVAQQQRDLGRSVTLLESRPLQCLYGALMWPWVQDPADPRLQPSGYGRPDEQGGDPHAHIWCSLPADIGAPGHAVRRADALDAHLARLPDDTDQLLTVFDAWLEPSRPLRQYLWAYTEQDERRARIVVSVLGATRVKQALRFLSKDYWRRYCGWPDLLTWQQTPAGPQDVELLEVKSSGDRLTEDQRTWISDNAEVLHLPFRLVKVHRTERYQRPHTS